MGIYVKGIELPKEPDEMIELAIFGDGRTVKTGESWRSPIDGKCYYGPSEDMNTYSALTVPPHGRLIDQDEYRDEFMNGVYELCSNDSDNYRANAIIDLFDEAPTVVEAEGVET